MRRLLLPLWFGVLCSACGFEVTGTSDSGVPPMEVTVGFRSPTSLEDEASGVTMVPVALSAPAEEAVSVRYDVTGGTAIPGVDFEATGGVLTFPAGETEAAIPITILPDGEEEQAESIDLELFSPTNARLGASRHTVTIAPDILPRIRFQTPVATTAGEDVSPTLVLALDLDALPDTTVDFVVDGTATFEADHALEGGTLQIPAGSRMLTLPVPVIDDDLDEYDETIVVRLTSSSNVVIDSALPTHTHTHTITSDDPPPSVSLTAATHTATEGSDSYVMTFQLSGPSGKQITVPYRVDQSSTATLGDDFAFDPAAQSLTFQPGEITKTVTVSFPDDNVHEGTELAVIVLDTPMNATLGATARLDLTIEDNDPEPTVSWGSPGDQQENERDMTSWSYTYNLVLAGLSSRTVTVTITPSGTATNGDDYSFPNGTQVTFAPGDQMKPLVLRVNADRQEESNETVVMTISTVINAQIGTPSARTHTIVNDD